MKLRKSFAWTALLLLTVGLAAAVVASNVYVHDYSDPEAARPYRSCMAIRESELPSLLAGEGHPVKVELVQLAAERMTDEQVGMEQLRSYVTWAAMHKKVPISWAE